MNKYRLNQQQPIHWPNVCAFCGAPATATVQTTCSVVTSVMPLILLIRTTHLRVRVRYPVCAQHLWKARVGGIVSARNLFNLALGVCWAILAISLVAFLLIHGIPVHDLDTLAIYCSIAVAGIAVFVLGHRWSPVRLSSAGEETITISIANPVYARNFEERNRDAIIPAVPWWKWEGWR